VYVHPPTMWCRVLCRDCFPLPEVWGVSTSAEMKISDIGLLIIHVGMRLYSNCHHGSTVIFCCYLLLCVEQLQFLSPTETSGSLSNVSARSRASVQRLAQRQEMNKTSCVCVCVCVYIYIYIFPMAQQPQWARASSLSKLRDHTQTHHTPLCWTRYQPHAETSTWQLSQQTVGFEPAISASEWPLGLAALGI